MSKAEDQALDIFKSICQSYLPKDPKSKYANPEEFWEDVKLVTAITNNVIETLGLKYRNNFVYIPPGYVFRFHYQHPRIGLLINSHSPKDICQAILENA